MTRIAKLLCLGAATFALSALPAQAAWKPTRTVNHRPRRHRRRRRPDGAVIQGIIQKHKLMSASVVVISKKGGSGAEGFLYVKNAEKRSHKLIITLSNLFTTPLATGSPFSWTDYTPVAMMALDEFVLWVNAKTSFNSPTEYIDAVKKAGGKMKMGGTGSKQEDQIITAAVEQKTGAKFTYVPYPAVARSAPSLSGSTSVRRSIIRSNASAIGVPAPCVRFACSTPSPCLIRPKSRPTCRGRISHRAIPRASTSSI